MTATTIKQVGVHKSDEDEDETYGSKKTKKRKAPATTARNVRNTTSTKKRLIKGSKYADEVSREISSNAYV